MKPLRLPPVACLGALLAGLWLGGCGPGVGGTGTDSVDGALAIFGAARSADCSVCLSIAVPTTSSGLVYQGLGASQPVVLRFSGRSVELSERCARRTLVADWGSTGAGDGRYYGVYRANGQAEGLAAALRVEVQADGSLRATLNDPFGTVLLGPMQLAATSTEPSAPQCP